MAYILYIGKGFFPTYLPTYLRVLKKIKIKIKIKLPTMVSYWKPGN
jgi:hypothetical protein